MKNIVSRLSAFLILLIGLSISHIASAKALFSDFYFFGDSLTDMGNNTTTYPAPVTNPGGSTWADYFANKFGGNADPSNQGGDNYAYAGAETGIGSTIGTTNTGALGQVQNYLQNHTVNSHALYSLWAGANDIENGLTNGFTPAQIISESTDNLSTIVQMLHNAGAKYIMVFNLPDLADTPFAQQIASLLGPAILDELQEISQAYNQVLASKLSAEGFDVIQLDIFNLLNAVISNPARFGFDPHLIAQECSQSLSDCTPSAYLFWDNEHPTSYGHQMVADYAFSIIEGPTRAALLAEAPINLMNAQNLNLENQLYNIRTGLINLPTGATTAFASSSYTPYRQSSQGTQSPGFNGKNTNLTAGIIHRINTNLLAGAGVAHSFGNVDFGKNAGGFNMTENTASLFSSYQYNPFYIDGLVNYGVINDSSITRNVPIGPSQNATSGKTEGSQIDGNLTLGYHVINESALQTGPLINIDYQSIRINAYAESGTMEGIAERFDNQTNNALTTSAGWQLAYLFNLNNTSVCHLRN